MLLSSESAVTKLTISAGARGSPLSRAQIKELQQDLANAGLNITLKPIFLTTLGDRDRKTSLRTLDKTDFFTRELDEGVLCGEFRIAVHSAKDLPDPMPDGLAVVAITEGVDPSDSLVLRKGFKLQTLPNQAKIGCSSERRETIVRSLRPDLQFVDIRGNIEQRLELIENGEIDGVVVAEAALIRLGLTHLNRMRLPGETVPMQGKLAVTARADDAEMREVFAALDSGRSGPGPEWTGVDQSGPE